MTRTWHAFILAAAAAAFVQAASAQEPPPPPKPGYEMEGRPGFVIHYEPESSVTWEAFEVEGMPSGLKRRLLSQSPSMGAVTQITYIPDGWRHPSGYHNADEELFILEGDLTIEDGNGTQKLSRYSYTFLPAGMAHGPMSSRQGAVAMHWIRGKPDFVASERHKRGARVHAAVRTWNHFDSPWSIGDPFPAYRVGGNFPGAVHKLLRQDPDTGENTWMTFNASIPATSRGVGNFGGGFEVHPSFEEYYFLEKSGDTVIGECLEQGLTQITYSDRSYWWRPGGIGHGGATSHGDGQPDYNIAIVRTGTRLWADYFTDCSYETQIEFTGNGFRTLDEKDRN
jgi:mannose-6-phosphate isomerase-like protein (cupin superfamily)